MDPEFITYKKFNDVALANELAELLDANDVRYFLEEEAPRLIHRFRTRGLRST